MNEKRSGEDRREDEVSHKDIMAGVQQNSERLDRLEEKVDQIRLPHDWEDILRDVAAVGRTGRLVRRMLVWGTPIVAAVYATWQFITNHPSNGG